MLRFPRNEEGKKEKKRKEGGKKGKQRREKRKGKERRRERQRDRVGWYIGKEEESVKKEMKVLCLLPGRKIFFGSW